MNHTTVTPPTQGKYILYKPRKPAHIATKTPTIPTSSYKTPKTGQYTPHCSPKALLKPTTIQCPLLTSFGLPFGQLLVFHPLHPSTIHSHQLHHFEEISIFVFVCHEEFPWYITVGSWNCISNNHALILSFQLSRPNHPA